jgi:hypothetical protein
MIPFIQKLIQYASIAMLTSEGSSKHFYAHACCVINNARIVAELQTENRVEEQNKNSINTFDDMVESNCDSVEQQTEMNE